MNALDLYCGAGGAARGLQQAGFHVVGVDDQPQPRYCGDAFVKADALEYLKNADLDRFDFIWASPPCQRHTALKSAPNAKGAAHRDWIPATRELLKRSGKPYCIENVIGAPLIGPTTLCGSMFRLQAPGGAALRRHRLFEASFPLTAPSPCRHGSGPVIGVYGAHVRDRRRPRGLNHRSGSNGPWAHAFMAMGLAVGSMTLAELSEAIPPAYARFVAENFLRRRQARQAKRVSHAGESTR
jgi:DNA (cytosine-5)-methyltransferase 1